MAGEPPPGIAVFTGGAPAHLARARSPTYGLTEVQTALRHCASFAMEFAQSADAKGRGEQRA